MDNKLEFLLETHGEIKSIVIEDMDGAILGIDPFSLKLIYSVSKCIEIISEKYELEYLDALDYFYFNVIAIHAGDRTPIWCDDDIQL